MNIKGNYELRVCVIDLDELKTYSEETQEYIGVDENTTDEDFYSKAEELGTVYSLGAFVENVNHQVTDNFTNSYVRFMLVNLDEPEEVVGIDSDCFLYVHDCETSFMIK